MLCREGTQPCRLVHSKNAAETVLSEEDFTGYWPDGARRIRDGVRNPSRAPLPAQPEQADVLNRTLAA